MARNPVVLGIAGLEAEPGDHICALFSGERERDQILVPFLRAGLASGDKCICVVDGTAPGEIVAALQAAGRHDSYAPVSMKLADLAKKNKLVRISRGGGEA